MNKTLHADRCRAIAKRLHDAAKKERLRVGGDELAACDVQWDAEWIDDSASRLEALEEELRLTRAEHYAQMENLRATVRLLARTAALVAEDGEAVQRRIAYHELCARQDSKRPEHAMAADALIAAEGESVVLMSRRNRRAEGITGYGQPKEAA